MLLPRSTTSRLGFQPARPSGSLSLAPTARIIRLAMDAKAYLFFIPGESLNLHEN